MTTMASDTRPSASDEPADIPGTRVKDLARMQVHSEDPSLSFESSPALTQRILLETPIQDQSQRWRQFISAAVNPLITQLWDMYQTDCRARGELEKPYELFTQLAATLTNPELPKYWEIYIADCELNDRYPEPFFTVMRRMQTVLNREQDKDVQGPY